MSTCERCEEFRRALISPPSHTIRDMLRKLQAEHRLEHARG